VTGCNIWPTIQPTEKQNNPNLPHANAAKHFEWAAEVNKRPRVTDNCALFIHYLDTGSYSVFAPTGLTVRFGMWSLTLTWNKQNAKINLSQISPNQIVVSHFMAPEKGFVARYFVLTVHVCATGITDYGFKLLKREVNPRDWPHVVHRIPDAMASDPSLDTGCLVLTEVFGYSRVPSGKCWDSTLNWPRPRLVTYIPIHY
jgi:hypothetical protein